MIRWDRRRARTLTNMSLIALYSFALGMLGYGLYYLGVRLG